MIQKMSDQSKIKFTEEPQTSKTEAVSNNKVEKKSKFELQPAKKLENSDVITNTRGSGILSAGGGGIKDTGGPKKYMGAETNNSIWNNDVISDMIKTQDNGEKIKETNANIQKVRNSIKQENLDNMVESLKSTDLRKNSTVASAGEFAGSNYLAPKKNLSIFDNDVFENLPEKTAGEKVSEEARKPKEKDESWKKHVGTRKSSSIVSGLFDKLMEGSEEKGQ